MRRLLTVVIRSLLLFFVAGYALLFLFNSAPQPATSSAPSTAGGMKTPFVVKIHARWCPICMASKPAWMKLQKSYGKRARFVVFDVTSGSSKETSRTEAVRLGLEEFFGSYHGRPGSVFIVDGASKEVLASMDGLHGYSAYSAALEEVLEPAPATALNSSRSTTPLMSR